MIQSLVVLISTQAGTGAQVSAMEQLLRFAKNDDQVFKRFNPNSKMVRSMQFEKVFSKPTKDPSQLEAALDFAAFLLRYFKNIAYCDFSDDAAIQLIVQRAEHF